MSFITQGVATIVRNAGKIARAVKGIKNSGPALVKGIKSSGVTIGKGLKSASAALSSGATAVSSGATAAGQSIKNTASYAGEAISKGASKVTNLFGKKPAGVVVEKVIQKGGPPVKPILRTRVREGNFRVAGKFDETIPSGLKNIGDIPKTGVPNQVLSKAERLNIARDTFKTAVVKPQKNMAYI
jgi:hypothetical protein